MFRPVNFQHKNIPITNVYPYLRLEDTRRFYLSYWRKQVM